MTERVVGHTHVPLLRVIPREYVNDATNAAPSQAKTDNRWNTPAFPALYCCCALSVAIAVARLKTDPCQDGEALDRIDGLGRRRGSGAAAQLCGDGGGALGRGQRGFARRRGLRPDLRRLDLRGLGVGDRRDGFGPRHGDRRRQRFDVRLGPRQRDEKRSHLRRGRFVARHRRRQRAKINGDVGRSRSGR